MQKYKTVISLVCCLGLFFAFSAPVFASATYENSPVFDASLDYLNAKPSGPWNAAVMSLAGQPVSDEAQATIQQDVMLGIESNFSSPAELERLIILLVKLEKNPIKYNRTNLLSSLYMHNNLYYDGLSSAAMALNAYQSVASAMEYDFKIADTVQNSPAIIINYILSSQQLSGSFSEKSGLSPDIIVTANILQALAPYKEDPMVASAIEKGLKWLSLQQNPDGSYTLYDKPSCDATAAVLSAIIVNDIDIKDPRFVRGGNTLVDGLRLFLNEDGGYAAYEGEASSVSATENALLALYTATYQKSPFLAPKVYPGYVPSQPAKTNYTPIVFTVGAAVAVLGLSAGLLIWIRFRKHRDSEKTPAVSYDNPTVEINIPMKADLPDFDSLDEKDEGMAQEK